MCILRQLHSLQFPIPCNLTSSACYFLPHHLPRPITTFAPWQIFLPRAYISHHSRSSYTYTWHRTYFIISLQIIESASENYSVLYYIFIFHQKLLSYVGLLLWYDALILMSYCNIYLYGTCSSFAGALFVFVVTFWQRHMAHIGAETIGLRFLFFNRVQVRFKNPILICASDKSLLCIIVFQVNRSRVYALLFL